MVLYETVSVLESVRTNRRKEEESSCSISKITPLPPVIRPYQPPIPFLQKVAWSKLSKLKPKFMQFLNILRRIYANVPF